MAAISVIFRVVVDKISLDEFSLTWMKYWIGETPVSFLNLLKNNVLLISDLKNDFSEWTQILLHKSII